MYFYACVLCLLYSVIYLISQQDHHQKMSFSFEIVLFLKLHFFEYNECYNELFFFHYKYDFLGLNMTMWMEIETIETLLQSLQLDKLITLFNENDIDLKLLMELSETELKTLLTEINLSLGKRYKIAKRLQKIKAGGKYARH